MKHLLNTLRNQEIYQRAEQAVNSLAVSYTHLTLPTKRIV